MASNPGSPAPDGGGAPLRRAVSASSRVALLLGALVIACAARAESFVDGFDEPLTMPRWQIQSRGECRIERVTAPVRAGGHAARFYTDADGRCEAVPWTLGSNLLGKQVREPFHEERWYGFSIYLPEGWRDPAPVEGRNTLVAQWHSTPDKFLLELESRGPPLALRVEGADWLITYGWDPRLISNGRRGGGDLWSAPFETGVWTDWVFHARWSWEDDGLLEIWKDGERIVRHEGPNAFNDFRGVYLKLGVYHPEVPREIYHDELRVGGADASYETIRPR